MDYFNYVADFFSSIFCSFSSPLFCHLIVLFAKAGTNYDL